MLQSLFLSHLQSSKGQKQLNELKEDILRKSRVVGKPCITSHVLTWFTFLQGGKQKVMALHSKANIKTSVRLKLG